jgi:hypothetical protein
MTTEHLRIYPNPHFFAQAQLDAKMARVQSKEVEAAQRVEARRVASQQAQRKLARK